MRTTTDARGVARLLLSFTGTYDAAEPTVWIRAHGFAAVSIEHVEARAGWERDLGEVLLSRGGVIEGHVVDGVGGRVAGASIWSVASERWDGWRLNEGGKGNRARLPLIPPPGATASDAEGRFRLSEVPENGGFLVATAPGRITGLTGRGYSGLARVDGAGPVEIRLERGAVVHGRVTHPRHPKVLQVLVGSRRGTFETHLTPDGIFRLDAVPEGPAMLALVEPAADGMGKRRWHFSELEVRIGMDALAVDLVPPGPLPEAEAPPVAGTVVAAESGDPITAFGLVLLAPDTSLHGAGPMEIESANGTFALPGVGPGIYDLWIRARGRAPAITRLEVAADRPATRLRVALPRSGTCLQGRVTDPRGAPLAGVRVEPYLSLRDPLLNWGALEGQRLPLYAGTVTDPGGEFRLEFLPSRPVAIVADGRSAGWGIGVVLEAEIAACPLRIVLPDAGSVEGVLIDGMGRPEGRGRIVAIPAGGAVPGHVAESDRSGKFVIAGLPPGDWTLGVPTFDMPGPYPGDQLQPRASVRVIAGRKSRTELRRSPRGVLTVEIAGEDPTGAGAEAQLLARPGVVIARGTAEAGESRIRLEAEIGEYTLRVWRYSGISVHVQGVSVVAGESAPIRVAYPSAVTRLTLAYADGVPVRDSRIVWCLPLPVVEQEGAVSEIKGGEVSLLGLGAGRYRVEVMDEERAAVAGVCDELALDGRDATLAVALRRVESGR